MSYEDINYIKENFKELAPDRKFMATERHEVIEYGVPVLDYPTIDSVRERLSEFIEEFKKQKECKNGLNEQLGAAFCFAPSTNAGTLLLLSKDTV